MYNDTLEKEKLLFLLLDDQLFILKKIIKIF